MYIYIYILLRLIKMVTIGFNSLCISSFMCKWKTPSFVQVSLYISDFFIYTYIYEWLWNQRKLHLLYFLLKKHTINRSENTKIIQNRTTLWTLCSYRTMLLNIMNFDDDELFIADHVICFILYLQMKVATYLHTVVINVYISLRLLRYVPNCLYAHN